MNLKSYSDRAGMSHAALMTRLSSNDSNYVAAKPEISGWTTWSNDSFLSQIKRKNIAAGHMETFWYQENFQPKFHISK